MGVCVSSGIGSLQAIEREYQKLLEKGPGRINPLLVPLMISNMAAGNVSIQFGLKGKSLNVVTACATGIHSIGEAMRAIQHGEAEVMVAGARESSITPIGVVGFTSLTAFPQRRILCGPPFPLMQSAAALLWAKAQASWYWNPWSTQRPGAQGSMQS